MFLILFFVHRKISTIRKRKLEELSAQNRRQSKATIEGMTVNGYDNDYSETKTKAEEMTQLSVINEKDLSEKINSVIKTRVAELVAPKSQTPATT